MQKHPPLQGLSAIRLRKFSSMPQQIEFWHNIDFKLLEINSKFGKSL